ncbi:hypothetical protein [Argonema galeatum]|uniref:hypothetical protein n=1 Tax=Argonema galeatum TaxID=2942762 RepID=UPI002011E77B|nr:hypothetical protein [Argonema galeatum]MCL1467700.1 hypothetical protein [Argonema galeatum A003/A1]
MNPYYSRSKHREDAAIRSSHTMNNSTVHICTWIHCDFTGEESNYPQVGRISSSPEFQEVYWRCAIVYFASSIRNNPQANHILFTNINQNKIPNTGKFKTQDFLVDKNVKIVTLPFTYQPPKNYFQKWRNQFYLFDIMKYLSNNSGLYDSLILLDSDCVWIDSVDKIVADLEKYGVLTYEIDYPPAHKIIGLSRLEMQTIYEELDNKSLEELPKYFGGEWFAASGREIRKIAAEIDSTWEWSLRKFAHNQPKFNESSYNLSYIYHKLGYDAGTGNPYIRRIWTTLFRNNNASSEDFKLHIWHMLAEKKYGIKRLFKEVSNPESLFWKLPPGKPFAEYAGRYLGIPKRTPLKLSLDLFDAVKSRLRKKI